MELILNSKRQQQHVWLPYMKKAAVNTRPTMSRSTAKNGYSVWGIGLPIAVTTTSCACMHATPPFQSNFIVSTSWMNPNMRQSSGKKMLQQTAEHKKGTREVPRGERKQASKEMSTPNKNHTQFEKSKGSGYSEEERLPCWERDTQEHKSWKMLSSPKQNKKSYPALSLSPSAPWPQSVHSWRQKATTQWDNHG